MVAVTPEQHVEVYGLFADRGFTGELRLSTSTRGRQRVFVIPAEDLGRLGDIPSLEAAVAGVLGRRTSIVAPSEHHRVTEPF